MPALWARRPPYGPGQPPSARPCRDKRRTATATFARGESERDPAFGPRLMQVSNRWGRAGPWALSTRRGPRAGRSRAKPCPQRAVPPRCDIVLRAERLRDFSVDRLGGFSYVPWLPVDSFLSPAFF